MPTKTKPNLANKKLPAAPKKVAESMVSRLRRKLGVNRKLFARLTGFSERAIANWEAGGTPDEPGFYLESGVAG